jgi:hypothetical protein
LNNAHQINKSTNQQINKSTLKHPSPSIEFHPSFWLIYPTVFSSGRSGCNLVPPCITG